MVYLSVSISYPSTQFEELYGSFVNLGAHLPPKDNSPYIYRVSLKKKKVIIFQKLFFEKNSKVKSLFDNSF